MRRLRSFVGLFFRRRTVHVPTLAGWTVLLLLVGFAPLLLGSGAERFLSTTQRVDDADVLILEAWTQTEGAEAAAKEFLASSQYRHLIVVGGLTGERWSRKRWREVEMAERELKRLHLTPPTVLAADVPDVRSHRTYATALVAARIIREKHLEPKGVNIITRGVHARRSRLTFSRAMGSDLKIGVVAWRPEGEYIDPWWNSSERAVDLLKESVGFLYEAVFHSGRPFSRGQRDLK